MIQAEARSLLKVDSGRLADSVERGRVLPQDVARVVVTHVIHRAEFAGGARALSAVREVSSTSLSAATHSDLLGQRIQAILSALRTVLDPECMTGMLHYAVGDASQHGLAIVGLQLLAESSGVQVAQRLLEFSTSTSAALAAADQELMARIEALPSQVARSAVGALREASLAERERDGQTARTFRNTARRLIRAFST